MRIIDRRFAPADEAGQCRSYKSGWWLTLECGHIKHLSSSDGNFERGGVAQKTNCEFCDKPKPRKKLVELERLADAIEKYDW